MIAAGRYWPELGPKAEPHFIILVVLDPFSEILRQVLNLDIQAYQSQ
jgi:hypothetical protein